MNVGNNLTERYHTPYKTNQNVGYFKGFMQTADGLVMAEQNNTEGGFIEKFVDYQEFHREWMSQPNTDYYFGHSYDVSKEMAGNAAKQKNHSTVYLKTEDMLYSGGNGTGLSFYLKYAENSTEENPIIVVKGVDENGNEFEQNISIKDINPSCATVVEMHALEAHYNVDKGGGLSSLPMMPGGYGEMGLNDRADFLSMFDKVIEDMKMLGRFDLMSFYMKNMNIYRNL